MATKFKSWIKRSLEFEYLLTVMVGMGAFAGLLGMGAAITMLDVSTKYAALTMLLSVVLIIFSIEMYRKHLRP